ncbi:RNA polymerase sigma factor [Opitutus sp. ER46]|uniref:RNA polymerase sigma factor n=1 Tax=Opitutus sp. ER46 TaxID=2161864 RepID=UPI0011B20142|nr:RNA polymerase sigma factor [Opitutus sp. ER46]
MPPADPEISRWFAEQVQPHEAALRAWLHHRFPDETEVDDVVQEAYIRLLRAATPCAIHSPKAFLFAVARNLALDRVRHRQSLPTQGFVDSDLSSVLDTNEDVVSAINRQQELALLTTAIQSLPDRCRQIFTLRKVYGLSQREIADRLGISVSTVSAQLTIGFNKCSEYMAERLRKERD